MVVEEPLAELRFTYTRGDAYKSGGGIVMRREQWLVSCVIIAATTAVAEPPANLSAMRDVDAITGYWHVLGENAFLPKGSRLDFAKNGVLKVVKAVKNEEIRGSYRLEGNSLRLTGDVGLIITNQPAAVSVYGKNVMVIDDARRPPLRTVLLRAAPIPRETAKIERAASEAHATCTAAVAKFYRDLLAAYERLADEKVSAVGRQKALERYDELVGHLREARNGYEQYRAIIEMLSRLDGDRRTEMLASEARLLGLADKGSVDKAAKEADTLYSLWIAATENEQLLGIYEAAYQNGTGSLRRATRRLADLKIEISDSYTEAGQSSPL